MGSAQTFYDRYWKDEHIKANPFDHQPGLWTDENFRFHMHCFKPYVHGRLLDFGCGEGQFLSKISPLCDSCAGVDVSQRVIETARTNHSDLQFEVGADILPFKDSEFDTITAVDVLEHILDLETVLEEFRRVLRPNGHLLIATSEFTRIKMILISILALHRFFYPTTPHIRYFTRKNLAQLLKSKGFTPVTYQKNRTYLGFIPQGQFVVAQVTK